METLKNLSEKERLYYSKVSLGVFLGILAGILNNSIPNISSFALVLLAICGILVLGLLARNYLGIEDMDSSRIYFSGTFTYFLFFLLFWTLIMTLVSSETLLPPTTLQ